MPRPHEKGPHYSPRLPRAIELRELCPSLLSPPWSWAQRVAAFLKRVLGVTKSHEKMDFMVEQLEKNWVEQKQLDFPAAELLRGFV